jgi:YD repeat-containing protein
LKEILDRNSSTDPGHNYKMTFSYDANGKLAEITEPSGRKTTFTWNGWQITQITAPGVRTVQFTYDGLALTSVIDPVGSTTEYTYNDNVVGFHITEIKTPLSPYPTVIGWAPLSITMPQTPENPDDYKTTFTMTEINQDFNGQIKVDVTDPEGYVTSYVSDRHKTQKITDAENNVTEYEYDLPFLTSAQGSEYGNRTSIKDQNGNATLYTYLDDSNLITSEETFDPQGKSYGITQYEYWQNTGNRLKDFSLKTKTKPGGAITSYDYDNYGNLLTITETSPGESPIITEYTYYYSSSEQGGFPGQVKSVKDPWQRTQPGNSGTVYTYNSGTAELLTVTDASGNNTTYTYYPATGFRETSTDRFENVTRYRYDNAGRVIGIDYPPTMGDDVLYNYNCCNLDNKKDENGKYTKYLYDETNNVKEVRQGLSDPDEPNPVFVTKYEYYQDGTLKSIEDAEQRVTTYEYYSNNRLKKAIYPDTTTEDTIMTAMVT